MLFISKKKVLKMIKRMMDDNMFRYHEYMKIFSDSDCTDNEKRDSEQLLNLYLGRYTELNKLYQQIKKS